MLLYPPVLFSFCPLGKAATSPLITGCVCEVSGLLCVSLWKGTRLTSHLSAQSGFVLQRRAAGSRHCSLGHCPDPVCLSVYLSAFVCQLVRPSFVSPHYCGGASRPWRVCPAEKPQNWHGLGVFGRWLHTRFIINVNIPRHGNVGVSSALIRLAAEVTDWCPKKWAYLCFKDLLWTAEDSFFILFAIKRKLEPH